MLSTVGRCFVWVVLAAPTLLLVRPLPLWLAAAYLAGFLWLMPPFILMLHFSAHRPVFNERGRWIGWAVTWLLGPFFG